MEYVITPLISLQKTTPHYKIFKLKRFFKIVQLSSCGNGSNHHKVDILLLLGLPQQALVEEKEQSYKNSQPSSVPFCNNFKYCMYAATEKKRKHRVLWIKVMTSFKPNRGKKTTLRRRKEIKTARTLGAQGGGGGDSEPLNRGNTL